MLLLLIVELCVSNFLSRERRRQIAGIVERRKKRILEEFPGGAFGVERFFFFYKIIRYWRADLRLNEPSYFVFC